MSIVLLFYFSVLFLFRFVILFEKKNYKNYYKSWLNYYFYPRPKGRGKVKLAIVSFSIHL